MIAFGIDHATGGDPPSPAALKKAGVKFVCRYLSGYASKDLGVKEARDLTTANIPIVVVWETGAKRAEDGFNAGVADASRAEALAHARGMPSTRPIYFAVDEDTTVGPNVSAYFKGVASVLGVKRTGAYGGYKVIKGLFDWNDGGPLITWGWQTYAWSGGKWDPRAHIQQYSNSHTVAGVDADYDRAMVNDYGQWFVGSVPAPEGDEMADVVSLGISDNSQTFKAGDSHEKGNGSVKWTKEYSDKAKLHGNDDMTLVILDSSDGHLWALCSATVELTGLEEGDEVELAWTRFTKDKSGNWVYGDDAWLEPFTAGRDGRFKRSVHGQFGLNTDQRLRLRVVNTSDKDVKVTSATMAKVTLLRY